MIAWSQRAPEERALLNPAFCSLVLWHTTAGYASVAAAPLPFEVAFLILPIVLHRETRDALPNAVTTSLAVWLGEHPLSRGGIAERATTLVGFTREALVFGGLHDLFAFPEGGVAANGDRKKAVATALRTSSDEVRLCAKRADFVGRWFAKAGSGGTVLALLGVRP